MNRTKNRYLACSLILGPLETPVNLFSASPVLPGADADQKQIFQRPNGLLPATLATLWQPQALWEAGCQLRNHCWRIKKDNS